MGATFCVSRCGLQGGDQCDALFLSVAVLFLTFNSSANAVNISFLADPFAGSTALTTPGLQVVGSEPFIEFNIATDVFAFDPIVFGIDQILFANDVAGNVPTSDVNVVVLQILDNDGDPLTPFGAGDLSDNTPDLKILARLTNLADQPDVLPAVTEENVAVTQPPGRPRRRLPATLLLMTTGGSVVGIAQTEA